MVVEVMRETGLGWMQKCMEDTHGRPTIIMYDNACHNNCHSPVLLCVVS